MSRRSLPSLALAAVFLLGAWLPVASAWGNGDQGEPSTTDDARSPQLMWPYANDGSHLPMKERVYFDGVALFAASSNAAPASVAFDPGLEGSRLLAPTQVTFMAYLGYWRDCNGDGLIGSALAPRPGGNLAQYPAVFLDKAGRARCPVGSPYNDGFYVDEFRWIGPHATPPRPTWPPSGSPDSDYWEYDHASCPIDDPLQSSWQQEPLLDTVCRRDAFDVSDPHAVVWSDWGRPSEPAIPASGFLPFPRGTLEDSTGTLQYADDLSAGGLSANYDLFLGSGSWEEKPCVGDRGNCVLPQTDYPPFQVKRLYNDSGSDDSYGHPFVHVWSYSEDDSNPDCSAFSENGVPLAPNADPRVDPAFQSDPTREGSLDPTIAENTRPYALRPDLLLFGHPTDDGCASHDEEIHSPEPYANLEWNKQGTLYHEGKKQIDESYTFVPDDGRTDLLTPAGLPANFPLDGGTGVVGSSGVCKMCAGRGGPGWFGDTSWYMTPPLAGAGVTKFTYHTFYASLSGNAFFNDTYAANSPAYGLPAGSLGAHTYGAEDCPWGFGQGAGGVKGWDCDPGDWWPITPWWTDQVVLGHKYDLGDVDCYDQRTFGGNGYTGPSVTVANLGLTDDPSRACPR